VHADAAQRKEEQKKKERKKRKKKEKKTDEIRVTGMTRQTAPSCLNAHKQSGALL